MSAGWSTLRTLFESANEEITRSEFEVFSGRLFEHHPGMLRVGWLPKIYRKERAEFEAAAVSDGVSGYRIKSFAGRNGLAGAAGAGPLFSGLLFDRTENLIGLRAGLFDRPDPLGHAGARARQRCGRGACRPDWFTTSKGGTHGVLVSVPVYVKGTSRTTIADRRRNLTGFVVGMFDLPQLLQSIRTATAASSAIVINAYPPDLGEASDRNIPVPDYSSAPPTPQMQRAFATGPHWSGTLRIGDANWQVQAIPAAGGRLTARYDRALTVLAAGIVITIFLGGLSRLWPAATRASSHWPTGGCWSSRRPTF